MMRMARFFSGDQGGLTLVETLVALGILGFIGVGFMTALSTGFRSEAIKEEQVLGHNLVRAALEEIRSQDYLDSASPSPYTITVPLPAGYSISVDTQDFCWPPPDPCTPDGNLQKNTATVSRDGDIVVTVEDLKARR